VGRKRLFYSAEFNPGEGGGGNEFTLPEKTKMGPSAKER